VKQIRELVEKAGRFLNTAAHALNHGDCDSSASRAYYAMFFMAEAALLSKGLTASSHKSVISLFGRNFVKTGILERSLGNAINDAYDMRLIGDYGVDRSVTKKEAEELLRAAQGFVQTVKGYLDRWMEKEAET
jgi:uncharacterized protein (UPF0332 family)